METPCPRCGNLKTESIRHGTVYSVCWRMGYHLRRCSYCNRPRLIPRGQGRHPTDMTWEELEDNFRHQIAATSGRLPARTPPDWDALAIPESLRVPVTSVPHAALAEETADTAEYPRCPRCDSTAVRRSRRRWYERLLKFPPMARCRKCRTRFRHPSYASGTYRHSHSLQ